MSKLEGGNKLIEGILMIAIVIVINIIAQFFYGYIDLTSDKRFTLSDSTIEMVEELDDVIYIQVLLDGEFPAGFKRLQASTLELLNQLRSINPLIDYELIDPGEGSVAQINEIRTALSEKGVFPTNLSVREAGKMTERLIYPYAMVKRANKEVAVNLLEPQVMGNEELTLNNSVNLLEYKIASAIHKLLKKEKPNIVITEGQGELINSQTASLFEKLKGDYDVGRIHLDSVVHLDTEIDLVIVAKPKLKFGPEAQFKLDQYIMNGGKVIWLIDQFNVNLDSINQNRMYVPEPIDHGLDDMLFKYGVRINNDLVLDLECSRIPQVIGRQGDKAQTSLFPWYYHLLASSRSTNPIVKGIDRTNLIFPSSIDTIETKANIRKEILLSSSNYSRRQIYPMRISFDILKIEPDPNQFSKKQIPLAVLLEGSFDSAFKNRVKEQMEVGLKKMGLSFKEQSDFTRQIVIADGDLFKNLYSPENNSIAPIGYNQWEKNIFNGNQEFIVNSIEYLLDDFGLIDSRSKEVRLRLLNKVKTNQERTKWQIINILLPLLFLAVFGLIYNWRRKRKYTID